jgi:hypothetical protein
MAAGQILLVNGPGTVDLWVGSPARRTGCLSGFEQAHRWVAGRLIPWIPAGVEPAGNVKKTVAQ